MLLTYFLRVMQINYASILELIEVWRGIEGESARLAATRHTDAQLLEMNQSINAMRDCLSDAQAYSTLYVQLHILIGQASGNAVIAYSVESDCEASLRGLERRQADQLNRVQVLHEVLGGAIAQGDAALAHQTMTLDMNEAIASFMAL